MEMERTSSLTRNATFLVITFVIIAAAFFITSQSGKLAPLPEGQLPQPGLTPLNPLYFTDTITERILIFLAISQEEKNKLAARFAQEKLAEINYIRSRSSAFYTGELINENAEITAIKQYEYYRRLAGLQPQSITPNNKKTALRPSYSGAANLFLATAAETANRFLTQPLPSSDVIFQKFYGILPSQFQEKLDKIAAFTGNLFKSFKNWFFDKISGLKMYIKEEIKARISNFIDHLFGSKNPESKKGDSSQN